MMGQTNNTNTSRNESAAIELVSLSGDGDESVGGRSISEILGVSGPGGSNGSTVGTPQGTNVGSNTDGTGNGSNPKPPVSSLQEAAKGGTVGEGGTRAGGGNTHIVDLDSGDVDMSDRGI